MFGQIDHLIYRSMKIDGIFTVEGRVLRASFIILHAKMASVPHPPPEYVHPTSDSTPNYVQYRISALHNHWDHVNAPRLVQPAVNLADNMAMFIHFVPIPTIRPT